MKPLILGAAIGSSSNAASLHHFLAQAQAAGCATHSLGTAVAPSRLIDGIADLRPSIVALSYRSTPETAARLFDEIHALIRERGLAGLRFILGGTPPVLRVAQASGLFERTFDGTESSAEIDTYLRAFISGEESRTAPAQTLVARIEQQAPYPLLRHRFGLPSLRGTIAGARQIAEAGVLDVLSLRTDWTSPESSLRPHPRQRGGDGASGPPLRNPDHFHALSTATRTGNLPLLQRCNGTGDLLLLSRMRGKTVRDAWAAVPLCWESVLDGASVLPLRETIAQKQEILRWCAARRVPVELTEARQWSLRDAHDALAVAMTFLAAYNAKQAGVRWVIVGFMLNTPPGTTPVNDLAKALALRTLLGMLEDETFTVYREVKPGSASCSSDPYIARGQTAAAIALGMTLRPHIVQVVSPGGAAHAATPEEVIENCRTARGTIRNMLDGGADPYGDDRVLERRAELEEDAQQILGALRKLGRSSTSDAWTDPSVLAKAIEWGLLDVPRFKEHPALCGDIVTACIDGAWRAVDARSGDAITESERIQRLVLDVFDALDPDAFPPGSAATGGD
jgi:hypothetical protein